MKFRPIALAIITLCLTLALAAYFSLKDSYTDQKIIQIWNYSKQSPETFKSLFPKETFNLIFQNKENYTVTDLESELKAAKMEGIRAISKYVLSNCTTLENSSRLCIDVQLEDTPPNLEFIKTFSSKWFPTLKVRFKNAGKRDNEFVVQLTTKLEKSSEEMSVDELIKHIQERNDK